MPRRPSALIVVVLATLLVASEARAWIERTVKSDAVTLDVERDGTAVVAHEILFAIRGGPLSDFSFEPIDADAELLPDATVTLAESGQAAGLPIPLTATKDGPKLSLHVERERGLRTGTYQIKFRYRTNLLALGHLRPDAQGTVVEWNSPSFADGVDSARVVFRLPRAPEPPRLKAAAEGESEGSVVDDRDGVFLSTFRRAPDKDELEVVRPHVARAEIVAWRILADRAAFAPEATPTEAPASAPAPGVASLASPAAPRATPSVELPPWMLATAVFSVAGLYGLLVARKSSAVEEACKEARAKSRALLRGPIVVRSVLSAAGVAGAATGVFLELPWVSAGSLLVAIAAATHLSPAPSPPLRGPGDWVRLGADVAFEAPAKKRRTSAWLLDAGTGLGFALFASLLLGFVAAAIAALRHSPFHGVAVLLGSAVLFPIFCTGRIAELPSAARTLEFLEWMHDALGRKEGVVVHPIARVPRGAEKPDEVRLSVMPARALPGLVSVEAGLDAHHGVFGVLSLPFVIVRVVDGSPAAEAMPKGLFWTRGRAADERVVVLRPKLPSRSVTLELLLAVAKRLAVAEPPRQVSKNDARSGGKASVTTKGGTTSSPAHAT